MKQEELRKLQLAQLEIAKEVKRVCDENGIQYFLTAGTALGAIRHKGFIPWDDDLDIGMLREEYDRFCKIANEKLNPEYYFQNWINDKEYHLPYGKVRKKGTTYIEQKANIKRRAEIFVDIIVYDDAPSDVNERKILTKKLNRLEQIILMKCKCRPWQEEKNVNMKVFLAFLPARVIALFTSLNYMVQLYEKALRTVKSDKLVYSQLGISFMYLMEKKWLENLTERQFEDDTFKIMQDYDAYLTCAYGDYMKLPPEEDRENRHQIVKLDFGE